MVGKDGRSISEDFCTRYAWLSPCASFFVLAIYPSTSIPNTSREMGRGKCVAVAVAVAVALSFFNSESGGCFRGLQKCVRERVDGAVGFVKNGR